MLELIIFAVCIALMVWASKKISVKPKFPVQKNKPNAATAHTVPAIAPIPTLLQLPSSGYCNFDIVGESHYQNNLQGVAGKKKRYGVRVTATAHVILENDNKHDPNAVRVDINGLTVGHLSRADAQQYRATVGKSGQCAALIVGGWRTNQYDEGDFGVKLDFKMPK